MRLCDFTVTIQKGKKHPRSQSHFRKNSQKPSMPAFCSAIKLACLKNALQALPCKCTAQDCRGIRWWVPSSTPATSAHVALHRAHIKGQFALGYYWWNGPSPITQRRVSLVPRQSAREMYCVLVPHAAEHPAHRNAPPLPPSL